VDNEDNGDKRDAFSRRAAAARSIPFPSFGNRVIEPSPAPRIEAAMEDSFATGPTVARIIQLAVAPVFLLAGIGSILNVLTARLARVIDRARGLEALLPGLDDGERDRTLVELKVLDRRMASAHWAIGFSTASALLVCLVVVLLFLADLTHRSYARSIAALFILAMASITVGLSLFLYEINVATRTLRVRRELLPDRRKSR